MKRINAALILLALIITVSELSASTAVQVHFNFYQGIRHTDKANPAVAASYYLKPVPGKTLVIKTEPTKEMAKIKRIYNLKDVKQLLQVTWRWQKGERSDKYREIILSGHEYRVSLALKKEKSSFRLELTERRGIQSKSILNTEMTLPLDNTSIFGFEDSQGKIYFLSFYRMKDPSNGSGIEYIKQVPKLTRRVDAVYPVQAISRQIEGTVVLEVEIDKQGNVTMAKVADGKYLILNEAAVKAVSQWRYSPYIENGTAKTVKFYVVLDFYFN